MLALQLKVFIAAGGRGHSATEHRKRQEKGEQPLQRFFDFYEVRRCV
jgi:hypothetical protein